MIMPLPNGSVTGTSSAAVLFAVLVITASPLVAAMVPVPATVHVFGMPSWKLSNAMILSPVVLGFGSHGPPTPSPSGSLLSLSIGHGSQASPTPSLSSSRWSGLYLPRQLSTE